MSDSQHVLEKFKSTKKVLTFDGFLNLAKPPLSREDGIKIMYQLEADGQVVGKWNGDQIDTISLTIRASS